MVFLNFFLVIYNIKENANQKYDHFVFIFVSLLTSIASLSELHVYVCPCSYIVKIELNW